MRYTHLILFALVVACRIAVAGQVTIEPDHADGIYAVGDTIAFRVGVSGDASSLHDLHYQFLHDANDAGSPAIPLKLNGVAATVSTPAAAAGTITLKITAKANDGKILRFFTGAAVAPFEIKPSAPRPEDFDAFWKRKFDELNKIPINAECTPAPLPSAMKAGDIDYFHVTLANINGTHVYGQLARPHRPGKYPAMLIFQGAGVYGLPIGNVIAPAHDGWLVLNIMAHDLPIDLPIEKYQALEHGELKNYMMIGSTDREKSYFVRMFLGCYRAADYLSSRPDWNGRVLLSFGKSQGGLQAIACGALHPKITAVISWITAGCDTCGGEAGRVTGWPGWPGNATAANRDAVMKTSRYFDAVNFAPDVRVPTLVCMGLADMTAPPTGVFSMYNRLGGGKEIRVAPAAAHASEGTSHRAFQKRTTEWETALLHGENVPPANADQ